MIPARSLSDRRTDQAQPARYAVSELATALRQALGADALRAFICPRHEGVLLSPFEGGGLSILVSETTTAFAVGFEDLRIDAGSFEEMLRLVRAALAGDIRVVTIHNGYTVVSRTAEQRAAEGGWTQLAGYCRRSWFGWRRVSVDVKRNALSRVDRNLSSVALCV